MLSEKLIFNSIRHGQRKKTNTHTDGTKINKFRPVIFLANSLKYEIINSSILYISIKSKMHAIIDIITFVQEQPIKLFLRYQWVL